jgi:hypothetical protein
VHVVAIGGHGGTSSGGPAGGFGAATAADVAVMPGEQLYVEVAGNGADGSDISGNFGEFAGGAGGFNGGAQGGQGCLPAGGAGGGGGASDIRTSPRGSGAPTDPSLGTRVVSAAGGGSGGGGAGGFGAGGSGGSAGGTGSNGAGITPGTGGGAAGSSMGGLAGTGAGSAAGGSLGNGGGGAADASDRGPSGSVGTGGGGGAGGLYGGGGGGGDAGGTGGGGGGGGSSGFGAGATNPSIAPDSSGTPSVTFTYTVSPPTISITTPANGASYTEGQVVTAIYSCIAPAPAGVTACSATVANGAAIDTHALGQHTFTVNAQDADGGAATRSVSYTVVAPPPERPVALKPGRYTLQITAANSQRQRSAPQWLNFTIVK